MAIVTELYEKTSLWANAFDIKEDGLDKPRLILRVAYQEFRDRVGLLISQIKTELPNLTLHDITHVDALWRVASEVAGSKYDLNPAEAFVLGGAFLLHDAAHCRAAYKGGLQEIKSTNEWRDAAAQRGLQFDELTQGTTDFCAVMFDTLRALHPIQAANLPFAVWGDTPENSMHLLPNADLREVYGHAVGKIAKSHWMSPHELEVFGNSKITSPTCLLPATWTVDLLKIAVLLRVADALHMDALRAPKFLMMISPVSDKYSEAHWTFQSRMNSIKCDSIRKEILVTSSPFPSNEQAAWWLAFDTARMADKELSAAHHLLRDYDLPLLDAREVAGIRSSEMFAKYVPAQSWTPVDTEVRISQVQTMVENFGGKKLYGDSPVLAIREILQNSIDSIHACRALNGLSEAEGSIEVALDEEANGYHWLHVTDTGIGMSRFVLLNVLLDFGRSLWRSSELRTEWSGLAATGFDAIGQFGIGFFSVFMLGTHVKVTTRRFESRDSEEQWLLEFADGTRQRPLLRVPSGIEKLKRHGTRISIKISKDVLKKIKPISKGQGTLKQTLLTLAPAIDIDLYLKQFHDNRELLIKANDWLCLTDEQLNDRLFPNKYNEDGSMDAAKDDHTHLMVVKNIDEKIVGKIGLITNNSHRLLIGVVDGLFAGLIKSPRLTGLVFCKRQENLARTSAHPDFSVENFVDWAQSYKTYFKNTNQLDIKNSYYLATLGVTDIDLVVGYVNGVYVKLSDFLSILINLKNFSVVENINYGIFSFEKNKLSSNEVMFLFDSDRDYFFYRSEFLRSLDTNNVESKNFNNWSIIGVIENSCKNIWCQFDRTKGKILIGIQNEKEVKKPGYSYFKC